MIMRSTSTRDLAAMRVRNRSRLATGGAALAAVALSAVVLLPSLLGGGPDRLPTLGAPPPTTRPKSADTAGVSRAAVLPASADGSHQEALAKGLLRADTASGCLWLEQPDGGSRTQLLLQGEAYSVDFGASPAAVLDGSTIVARVGDEVQAGGGLSDDEAGVDGCPVPPPVYVGYFERPAAPPEHVAGGESPVPPPDPAGAEICKDSADGNQCYDIGSGQAKRLSAALATGRLRQPDAAECAAAPVAIYRATFMPASGLLDPWVWEIPSAACLPMSVDSTRFDLPDDARDTVTRIWDAAGLFPVDGEATGRRTPGPPRR